jgi:hypothetical protein
MFMDIYLQLKLRYNAPKEKVMPEIVQLALSYTGGLANENALDLYDVGQALVGFQRSLALTTHLILNDEIITQSPSLRGATILSLPPQQGSWKAVAVIATLGTGIYNLGTAPKDTPLGHLVRSAYDYVISEALGVHVDYDKTLGQQYKELKKSEPILPEIDELRLDSLIEKCEFAIREMHRPIVKSRTATEATITTTLGDTTRPLSHPLNRETYEFISFTERSLSPLDLTGRISSYNINTFKGRVYLPQQNRPIPFELAEEARNTLGVLAIVQSLSANAEQRTHGEGEIHFNAFQNLSRTGRLKSLFITEISSTRR